MEQYFRSIGIFHTRFGAGTYRVTGMVVIRRTRFVFQYFPFLIGAALAFFHRFFECNFYRTCFTRSQPPLNLVIAMRTPSRHAKGTPAAVIGPPFIPAPMYFRVIGAESRLVCPDIPPAIVAPFGQVFGRFFRPTVRAHEIGCQYLCNFTDGAVFHQITCPIVQGHGSLLRTHLGNPFVFTCNLYHFAAFGNGQTHGFFNIDIHPHGHGMTGDPGARMGCGFHHHPVQIFFFDHGSEIGVAVYCDILLGKCGNAGIYPGTETVAYRCNSNGGNFHAGLGNIATASSQSDKPNVQGFVWTGTIHTQHTRGKEQRCRCGDTLQETSAIHHGSNSRVLFASQ